MPNIDLLRIVLINIAEENLDELLANYNQKYGFDLSQHFEYFYSINKKVGLKLKKLLIFRLIFNEKKEKSWWKFWEKTDNRNELIDRLIFVKGLQALLGNPNWCSKECDVTSKFENIKFPKNIEKISLNNSSQQQKISYNGKTITVPY